MIYRKFKEAMVDFCERLGITDEGYTNPYLYTEHGARNTCVRTDIYPSNKTIVLTFIPCKYASVVFTSSPNSIIRGIDTVVENMEPNNIDDFRVMIKHLEHDNIPQSIAEVIGFKLFELGCGYTDSLEVITSRSLYDISYKYILTKLTSTSDHEEFKSHASKFNDYVKFDNELMYTYARIDIDSALEILKMIKETKIFPNITVKEKDLVRAATTY